MSKTYEDYVQESAETRRDLDVVLHPMFGALKKAFALAFESVGLGRGDFKRLSDMKYYQGGYPQPSSPPREHALAVQVANILKMEKLAGSESFRKFLGENGVVIGVNGIQDIPDDYTLGADEAKEFDEAWAIAGIDKKAPDNRQELLNILIDKAQKLQGEICSEADKIKVDAADEVETQFKIKKGNFIKAVGLATVKLRRGEGVMAEKLDDLNDQIENLEQAIAPLNK